MQTTQTELKTTTLDKLKDVLSANDYELFRRAVVMECRVTTASWSHWTTGKYTPETKYQPLIDRVAARFGLTVFNSPVAVEGGRNEN